MEILYRFSHVTTHHLMPTVQSEAQQFRCAYDSHAGGNVYVYTDSINTNFFGANMPNAVQLNRGSSLLSLVIPKYVANMGPCFSCHCY